MSVSNKKASFVYGELFRLIKRIDPTISAVEYEKDAGEEYVYVYYRSDVRVRVCVTADSLSALTRDVLSKIE